MPHSSCNYDKTRYFTETASEGDDINDYLLHVCRYRGNDATPRNLLNAEYRLRRSPISWMGDQQTILPSHALSHPPQEEPKTITSAKPFSFTRNHQCLETPSSIDEEWVSSFHSTAILRDSNLNNYTTLQCCLFDSYRPSTLPSSPVMICRFVSTQNTDGCSPGMDTCCLCF